MEDSDLPNRDGDDQGECFRYPCFEYQADDLREDMVKRSNLREEQMMYWLAEVVSYIHGQNNHHLAVSNIAIYRRRFSGYGVMLALFEP